MQLKKVLRERERTFKVAFSNPNLTQQSSNQLVQPQQQLVDLFLGVTEPLRSHCPEHLRVVVYTTCWMGEDEP